MTRAAHCTSCCTSVRRRMSPSQTSSRGCTRGCWNPWRSHLERTCGSKLPSWPQPPVALRGQRQAQPQGQRQAPPARPMYQRRDTWYEFLIKQFNPSNLDYGAWIEERRQVFLDASVRNPYFKYSLGTTIALLIMAMLYTKQWIDHRRAMWITAEMMTDLYNHDLYSRDVAEKAIQKYNQHIERCNRAIEAAQHGTAIPVADAGHESCNVELNRVVGERDEYLRELNDTKTKLTTKEQTLTALSLRVEGMSVKPVASGMAGTSVELSSADPNVVRHINNLQ